MNKNSATRSIYFNYNVMIMNITHMLTHVLGRVHPAIFSTLMEEFSLSLQEIGIIAAIPNLFQVLLYIPVGLISDKFGSKKIIMSSLIMGFLGAFFISQTNNLIILILGISLIFLQVTFYHPSAYSYVTNILNAKDRSKALGINGAFANIGHALGPLSVSIFIGLFAFGWRTIYLFWSIPIILSIYAVFRTSTIKRKENAPAAIIKKKPTYKSLLNRNLISFLVSRSLIMFTTSIIATFIVLYLENVRGLSNASASLIFSGNNFVGLLAAPLGGVLASRFGDKRWLVFALSLSCLSLGLSIVFPSLILFVVFYLLYGFFSTLGMGARSAMVALLIPSEHRGLGYGLFFLPSGISSVFAPIIAGYSATMWGFNSIFYIAIITYFVSLVILNYGVKTD